MLLHFIRTYPTIATILIIAPVVLTVVIALALTRKTDTDSDSLQDHFNNL